MMRSLLLIICCALVVLADDKPPGPILPLKTCGPTEATCANGDCVLKSDVCDGSYDCSDGSDERNCSKNFF